MIKSICVSVCMLFSIGLAAQEASDFPMQKLGAEDWQLAKSGWKTAGSVTLNPVNEKKTLITPGSAVLLARGNAGVLISPLAAQDIKIRFDFMLGAGTSAELRLGNTGIFIGNTSPLTGSILLENNKTVAPLKNAQKAPGLWQTLELVYSPASQPGENGSVEKVTLNGLILHENVFIEPSSGGKGSIAFVASSGTLAVKDFSYLLFSNQKPVSLGELSYTIQDTYGFDRSFEPKGTPLVSGKTSVLSYDVPNDFSRYILNFRGKLKVDEAGKYAFTMDYQGAGHLKIDGKQIAGSKEWTYRAPFTGMIDLTAGEHDFEYQYQTIFWRPAMGLYVSSGKIRPYALHASSALPLPEMVGGIYEETLSDKVRTIRSFVNFKNTKKTKVISVGTPSQVHYTFDLDNAALLYAWRGNFADVTQMWHDRGEPQVISATGLKTTFSGKPPFFERNGNPKDSADVYNDFINTKYTLETKGLPTFFYRWKGADLGLSFIPSGENLQVSVTSTDYSAFSLLLDEGKEVEQIEKGLYRVDDHYIRTDSALKTKIIRNGGSALLVADLQKPLTYTIIW